MSKGTLKSLPVLMHHYVSNYPNSIAMPPALFEEQCRVMAEAGWRGVGLDEAEAFLEKGEALPPKSCLITFDDGYLDNYVYAWPILKKYGHKGVIFAVAELMEAGAGNAAGCSQEQCSGASFNDSSDNHSAARSGNTAQEQCLRPTLEDVWAGKISAADLPQVDSPIQLAERGYQKRQDLFLNWNEIRLMEKSGVMYTAAHSLRHEQVFCCADYKELWAPMQQMRTFYHTNPDLLWGQPRFKSIPELFGAAFIPNLKFLEAIAALVPQDEARAFDFFADATKVAALEQLIARFKGDLGHMETAAEQKARLYALMHKNQGILQRELGHSVKSFCWPWGLGSQLALEAGLDAGFKVFYSTEYGINKAGSALDVKRFKAKSKKPAWLMQRLALYSSPVLGALYTKMRF